MSKTKKYGIHSIANILPMANAAEFASLKQDIAKNGLREPIYLFDNKIIDGRNRYKACQELGIDPVTRQYKGTESSLFDFVISLNLHRRHLTTSQKACMAVDVFDTVERQTKENLSKKMAAIRKGDATKPENENTSQTLSKMFGVSERYIYDAKKLLQESPELFNKVKSNIDNYTLQKALKELKAAKTLEQDCAILQKLGIVNDAADVVFTTADKRKLDELIKFGMNESNARKFIIQHKRKPKPDKQPTGTNKKEIKFRLDENEKIGLQTYAKQKNMSVAEVIRELIHGKIKDLA